MNVLQLSNGETEIGSVYDIASQTFTPFHFSTNAFCAGHSVAEDGTVIIAGKQPLVCSPFPVNDHAHVSGDVDKSRLAGAVCMCVCVGHVLTHISWGAFVHLSVRVTIYTMP